MKKTDRKLDMSSFRVAKATRKTLAALLTVCLLLGLLPTAALALDEPTHDHTGWTAVTMDTGDTSKINVGGVKQESNTLVNGNYYLDGDITVPLTVNTGTVNLCLNNHSVTVDSGHAVTVGSGDSLTLWDCAAGSTGKIAYTGTSSSYYGIYNNGTLTLHSGAVEGYYCGVTNYSTSTFTMTGGSVTATDTSGRGVYNSSSSSVFRLSGGSVSGGRYGIYNDSSGSQVYLSGAPSISGGTAGIYTNSYSSNIYADDGAGETAVPYSGQPISLAYSRYNKGNTAVYQVTEDTKDKFTLADSDYELEIPENGDVLKIQGKPQALTWYGIDGEDGGALSGGGYPASIPYDTYLRTSELPAAPAVEGKLFLGWLYKQGDDSDWNTRYWPGRYITNATAFKADYIDGFPGGGSGTESDPYQIADAADLQTLAAIVNKGSDACNNRDVWYRLTENIDLSAVCGEGIGSWTPIGYGESNYSFKANLDGNDKTISNLYINIENSEDKYQGLFGRIYGATVKNLTITGSVTAGSDYGALAGKIENSTVENVDVTGVALAPYGYTPDGNRIMAHKIDGDDNTTIHIQGNYKNNWIQTTYARAGYTVATTDNLKGAVTAEAEFINGGRYVQLSYTVTAGETAITDGKLAVHADVQIGDNDGAAVEVIQNAAGEVIGLKMVDTHSNERGCLSQDAQFNLYFDGTGGVTPVDTYWFGFYGERTNINSTYGRIYFAPLNDDTKSSNRTYEQVDGVYTRLTGTDSGFAVSWQNINLDAGESKTYSFILGVGEKADPPQWSDGKAVSLTLAADVEQNNRLVNVSAKVKDAAGLTDTLYYSVDGGDGEVLGEVTADGATMKAITGQLDLSGYPNGVYTFSFWVVNSKGAASASVEREITITADGIEGLDSGDEPAHDHVWAAAWSKNDTHHWHECAADGCDVTSNSGKDGYGAHVYDDGQDAECNTCGYTREITYGISGTVTDKDDNAVTGAEVKLMRGREQIGESVTTDNQGNYSFTGVAPGLYNVVAAKDGVTKTILVEITDQNADNQNIKMPDGQKNSMVEVTGPDTPALVVGGVDQIAEAETVTAGETVTVTLTVEKKAESAAENADAIKRVADGQTLEFLDLSLIKTVTGGTSDETTNITDTQGKVLEIVVPYDFTGKTGVTVYRYHDTKAEPLDQEDTKRGGTFRLDTANGLIHIYATKFSTYAIGYTPAAAVYTLTVNGGSGGGSYAAGTTVNIFAAVPSGKRFAGWTGAAVADAGSVGTTLTMPAHDTTVTANFQSVSNGGSGGGGWSGPAVYSVETPSTDGGKVAASPANAARGAAVTLTLTPDQGYEIGGIAVTDRSGREIAVTAKGDGTYSIIMPDGKVTAIGMFIKITGGYGDCSRDSTCPLWAYSDTGLEMWYHDGVHYCIESGLMNGYGNGLFGPDDHLSRAQFAQILFNKEGRPVVNYLMRYSDVAAGMWYTEAVRWATSQGIVSGYGNGRFGPNDNITREQLAVMLWRYAGSPAAASGGLPFTDGDRAGGYALEALRWAVENGIMGGYGDGRLAPRGLATRAQAAQMLMNFLENR